MRIPPPHGGAVAAVILSASAFAQTPLEFPMRSLGPDAVVGLPALVNDADQVRGLLAHDAVRLLGFEIPGGATVDLELERVDLAKRKFGFRVDGEPAGDLLAGLDLSVWMGEIAGMPGSEVVLSFSNVGTRGWVNDRETLVHLMPQPGAGGDWAQGQSLVVRERDLLERGSSIGEYCAAGEVERLSPPVIQNPGQGGGALPMKAAGACSFWECEIAIETDFQLYEVFGSDLAAETAYVTTLLAASSARYEEQIDTILSFPYVQLYTSSNDPWSTPDSGGGSGTMLDEFVNAWSGAIPGGARIGHLLSGANLGGGIAYLGVLCDDAQDFSFAVSGNIDGSVPFPITVNPFNWDFMVFTHETGHNFNSPHTHDYSPQIDNCANGDCITNGTVMSYCHLCSGGLSNVTTYFHEPAVVPVMKSHASACLPFFAPLKVDALAQPVLVTENTSTALTVELQGTAVGTVDLEYRFSPSDEFTAIAMTAQGGGSYTANLPGADCGQTPEWFYSVTEASCGPYSTGVYSAAVGTLSVFQLESFEFGTTWTVGSAGDDATTGVWESGDPNGTGAQPADDATAGGSICWFTGQGTPGGSLGENDVDGGKTTLTSDTLDLSGGDAMISYYRWYSNDTGSTPGSDVFVVDVSNDGGANWSNVETVGPAGASGGWIYSEFRVSDVVAPTANVLVRFVASDEGEGSIVEAAIDEFRVFDVSCTICQTDLGFGGPGTTTLSVCGSPLSGGNSAELLVSGAPSNAAVWLALGGASNPTPLLGGTVVPIPAAAVVGGATDGAGQWTFPVSGGAGPLTVYLQAFVFDVSQAGWLQISNAVAADFMP